jgi:hypothetical protein
MGRPNADLKKWTTLIKQRRQPFTHGQPPQSALALLPFLTAAPLQSFLLTEQLVSDIAK